MSYRACQISRSRTGLTRLTGLTATQADAACALAPHSSRFGHCESRSPINSAPHSRQRQTRNVPTMNRPVSSRLQTLHRVSLEWLH
jgi:hypothetical protein